MVYALVSPLALEFETGDLEPFIASLTLYTFDSRDGIQSGKSSEEFWFPAGDWKERITDIQRVGSEEEHPMELWHQRKHKAIQSQPYICRVAIVPSTRCGIVLLEDRPSSVV